MWATLFEPLSSRAKFEYNWPLTEGIQSMRVLMQNRPNALTQRGGDTIVLERLSEGLRERGVRVDIDLTGEAELSNYQLVHLYNFATPVFTEQLARRCVAFGVPYVVTTLYEDWPLFYNQMHLHFEALRAYFEAGQPRARWGELAESVRHCEPKERLENGWTAQHAAGLMATGAGEERALRRDYGSAIPTFVCHVGCDIAPFRDDGSLFVSKFGMRDFVLCVGRLETRKNQLMLLKALEDSDLPVVIATSGFTYQPEYAAACRGFRRKGETLFLERLEPELLSSAYAAARVHALPSWYELPGIVSLEAARLGANVVASDFGTARDYFGELAYYARPDSPEDILNAVTAAFHQPKSPALAERVSRYTWSNACEETLGVYEKVLSV